MSRSLPHPWLNRFAWLTALATLLLIGIGGLVTSKGAGMAVPDWPTTYGYNMFLFPFHLWGVGTGIFYEHSHRLFASFVGFLTTILALWLWFREPRPWLRWLGVAAFCAVVLQGILGGLRVTLLKDEIGIVHAALAQGFLVLVTLIALAASGAGERLVSNLRLVPASTGLRRWVIATAVLVALQLLLGASMRHQHAGLAVPDFPLAYGKIWPPMDAEFIARVNFGRMGVQEFQPVTAFQIGLHMAHRILALAILAGVGMAFWRTRREQGRGTVLGRLMHVWLGLICLQAFLGAFTVWSNKAADVATAHVLLGAVTLVWSAILSLGLLGAARTSPGEIRVQTSSPRHTGAPFSLPKRTSAERAL